MRIDSHQHFWKYTVETHGWINDEMSAIRKDFFPADFIPNLSDHQLQGTIAVQADQSEQETDFLLTLAEQNDFIKGVVGWMDLKDPNAELKMVSYANRNKLVGFRSIMQGAKDEDFFLNDYFIQHVNKLSAFNWTYDLLVYHYQMSSLIEFLGKIKDTRLILDHIGKPDIKNGEIKKWKESINILANHPGIYCKLSGMITEADYQQWTYEQLKPYMDIVFEAFGADRICYGSDWPVCLVAGSYTQTIGVVERYLESADVETKKKIFGLNAVNFYKL